MKTFKTTQLPTELYFIFNDDDEIYDGELLEITDIDEECNSCRLIAAIPQRARMQLPYSFLDSDAIHLPTGVHFFLNYDDAVKQLTSQNA